MSKLEVISLSLTAGYMGIDSENHLFRILHKVFTDRIERTVYNRCRRKLIAIINDQFMTRRNYAKSFSGFKTRIIAKITTLLMFQYINKVIYNRNINNVKISMV